MIETLVLAALAGLAIAGLGAYKDTREYDGVRYEDFSFRVFGRSVALACLVACAVWWLNWLNLRTAAPPTIVLVVVASERLITEAYKQFVRPAPVGRRVPSHAAILGRPVESRLARLSLGGMFVVAVTLVLAGVGRIGTVSAGPQGVGFGTLCGAIVAVGGAWKDAPIEGWSTRAFFRSPIAGALVTVLVSACAVTGISAFTGATDSTTLFFVCLGGERLTVESYKAFVRRKVPSKFFMKTVALRQSPETPWRVRMAEDTDPRRPWVAVG